MAKNLPEKNALVVARLDGARHHSGWAFVREGWAFMVNWGEGTDHTVADGWADRFYREALEKIDADYAEVMEWVYVRDLPSISQQVNPEDSDQ